MERHPWRGVERAAREAPSLPDEILRRIEREGPLAASDFKVGPRRQGMWAWSRPKMVLEWLLATGRVGVAQRRGFERLYDLPDRVMPGEVLAAPTPTPEEAMEALLLESARALAVATATDLADYFRLRPVAARPRVARLVEAGRLREVRVEGWKEPAYVPADVRTAPRAVAGAPCFIDKMPNNWAHVGLIHLILPNARIIDARRHPLSCCFSGFKQHFARGQGFTYSLEDLGHYYRDYVRLMAHIDAVLPGRVHRVIYERMVEDTEGEVRRLLAYCGLDFDERCLRFYENERAVRTASSEQVRSPIYRDSMDQCRHYSAWLRPLEQALGPALTAYPDAPDFPDAV